MDSQLPAVPLVHVISTDLRGVAAVEATGEDGEEYCVIDSTVIVDNPEARECAFQVYLRAQKRAVRRRRPGLAT